MPQSSARFQQLLCKMWCIIQLLSFLLTFQFLSLVWAGSDNKSRLNPLKNTADRIAAHGYPVERHSVVTEDGYILTMFRIPRKTSRSAVLLMHGLFFTSDAWVLNGPNDALPFILADGGHDVWLGNTRGNHYARNHTVKSVHHFSFWSFSFHEIGHFDLAAMINYILTANEQHLQSLHYVGHSQGTTSFFAFLATRPAYNKLIRTAHMLAPAGYMSNASSPILRLLSPYLGLDSTYTRLFAHQEFVPYNDFILLMLFNTCGTQATFHSICSQILPWLPMLQEVRRFNETSTEAISEIAPGGASTDQILHYMQLFNSGYFRMFDLGHVRNLKVYGQAKPLDYSLENIVAPMHLWYSDNDMFVAVEDVSRLAARLPNKIMHKIEDPWWGHGEFLYSLKVKHVINEPILEIINEFNENMCNEP